MKRRVRSVVVVAVGPADSAALASAWDALASSASLAFSASVDSSAGASPEESSPASSAALRFSNSAISALMSSSALAP